MFLSFRFSYLQKERHITSPSTLPDANVHPSHPKLVEAHVDVIPTFRPSQRSFEPGKKTGCQSRKGEDEEMTDQWLAVMEPLSSIPRHPDHGPTASRVGDQIFCPQMTYLRLRVPRLFITHSAMGRPDSVRTWKGYVNTVHGGGRVASWRYLHLPQKNT